MALNTLLIFSKIRSLTSLLDDVVTLFIKENSVLLVPHLNQALYSYLDENDIENFQISEVNEYQTISVRNFITELLEHVGVSLAFSGKATFEKGVILEAEAQKMIDLGLRFDHFKMGQTLIRNAAEENLDIFVENRYNMSHLITMAAQYLRVHIALRNTQYFI